MEISAIEELLTELLAHTVVLRAGADDLTRVLARRDVELPDVIVSANRVADRTSEVLRIMRMLVGQDHVAMLPAEAWLQGWAPDE
jgi:hypothetical protein